MRWIASICGYMCLSRVKNRFFGLTGTPTSRDVPRGLHIYMYIYIYICTHSYEIGPKQHNGFAFFVFARANP